jgi:hypothetical protein
MDKILSINLETSTAPIVQEVRGRDYIEYGTEDWKNLYPQFLIDLYYNSSTHAAIVNATAEMISAEDLVITDEDDRDEEARVKLQNFNQSSQGLMLFKKYAITTCIFLAKIIGVQNYPNTG